MTPSDATGLSSAQVLSTRAVSGYNEIPEPKRSLFLSFLKRLSGPIAWLLEACAAITGVLGSFDNMGLIIGLLLLNAVVGTVEQHGADAAVAALKRRLSSVTRTLRDGAWIEIPSRELVCLDVLRLRAGDVVPADVELFEGSLECDLSALTGESGAVVVAAGAPAPAGALCRHGEALCLVTHTGAATSFGRTVGLVTAAQPPSRAAGILGRATVALFAVGIANAAAILVTVAVRGEALLDVSPLVILVLVSCIPSALPAFFTVATAHGAHELANRGVLVASLLALDNAATMNFMCVDKTGTLTLNTPVLRYVVPFFPGDPLNEGRLIELPAAGPAEAGPSAPPPPTSLVRVASRALMSRVVTSLRSCCSSSRCPSPRPDPSVAAVPEPPSSIRILVGPGDAAAPAPIAAPPGVPALLCTAALASAVADFDAIDGAILRAASGPWGGGEDRGWITRVFTPFDPLTRRTEAIVELRQEHGAASQVLLSVGTVMRCVKGAPATVAGLCCPADAWLTAATRSLAAQGCRALGVACSAPLPPGTSEASAVRAPLLFLGLLGLRDPPRPESAAVIAQLHGLGVRVLMLTGDSLDVARAIALQVGIGSRVVRATAHEDVLLALPDPGLAAVAAGWAVCCWRAWGGFVTSIAVRATTGFVRRRVVASAVELPAVVLHTTIVPAAAATLMTPADLAAHVAASARFAQSYDGIAEVKPEHKFGVVRALQHAGCVVGMTGDGVNDAPALAQADVGIAVLSATDIAKAAAGIVLTESGLSRIAILIEVSRTVHTRMLTYLINKVAKELFQGLFIVVCYLAFGIFVLSALHLVCTLLLVDFVTLAIATDTERGSTRPSSWELKTPVVLGLVLGGLGILESFGAVLYVTRVGAYTIDSPELQTLAFELVVYASALNVLLARSPARFCWASGSLPSRFLTGALVALTVTSVLLSTLGPGNIAAIPPSHCFAALAWVVGWSLVVNDPLKVATAKALEAHILRQSQLPQDERC